MGKKQEKTWKLYFICCITAIGGLLFGYDTGVISGAILFIQKDFPMTMFQEELIVSVVSLGAIVGALSSGPLSDRLGRKKTMLIASCIFMLSSILLARSASIEWLIVGRLIVGLALGVSSATAPLYIAEMAPGEVRGALVTFNQLAITVGILLAYIAGYAFSDEARWRPMFFIAAIPAAIQFCVMFFFPKSPRWLITQGEREEALSVLTRYWRSSKEAEIEVQGIEQHVKKERGTFRDLFQPKARAALFAGVGLTIIQQAAGTNAVIYYAPTIFTFAGFSSASAAILATVWIGVVNVLMTCIAIWLIDRIGRKPLLSMGLAGMVMSLVILGFAFYLPDTEHILGGISIASLICYIAFFAFSLGPNGWLINAEIYPLHIRGRAMGVATCANWGTNFLVTVSFLHLGRLLGEAGVFWLYGLIGLIGLWFIYRYVPETKDKTLEEIEDALQGAEEEWS